MAELIEKTKVFRARPDPGLMRNDPLAYLEYDHKAQRALADLLETVADGLPDRVAAAPAALSASLLRDSTQRRAALEVETLFPLIETLAGAQTSLRRAVLLARRETGDFAGRAIELAEELDALAERGESANAEALGFMLRAYFDGLRRHLDWVDLAILGPLREGLSADDRARLGDSFAALHAAARLSDWPRLALVPGARAAGAGR